MFLNYCLYIGCELCVFQIESLKQEITKKEEMVTEHTKAVSELSKTSQTQSKRIKLLEDTVTAKANQCERLQRNVSSKLIVTVS